MRTVDISSKYKKQLRKVSSYKSFKKDKYNKALSQLMKKEPLDPYFDDHPAAKCSPGELQGCKIIHIAPNICIVYKIINNDETIYLKYIGSHQDLNLTESKKQLHTRIQLRDDKLEYWI